MIQSVGVGVRILALCSGEQANDRSSIVLSFGRHKGKRLSSVSSCYLSWMVANLPSDPWGDLAQQHLSDRQSSPFSSHWRSIESSLASAQSLEEARAIQARIFAGFPGAAENAQLGNLLVRAMARLGGTKEARAAFARIETKDAASWSAMIEGYSSNGQHRKAMDLYRRMLFQAEVEPGEGIFSAALEACGSLKMPKEGIAVHARIAAAGQDLLDSLQIKILGMYVSCQFIDCAATFFQSVVRRDASSWNAMVAAFAQHGHFDEALGLYETMVSRGVRPDAHVRRCAILACAVQGRLELGLSIREETTPGPPSVGVENSVLNLFARCGDMERAWDFFRGMRERDAVSWNTMLWACDHRGLHRDALALFREMDLEGVETNLFALRSIVRVCSTSLAEECEGIYDWEMLNFME